MDDRIGGDRSRVWRKCVVYLQAEQEDGGFGCVGGDGMVDDVILSLMDAEVWHKSLRCDAFNRWCEQLQFRV